MIARKPNRRRQQGYITVLLTEMTVAVGLMAVVLIPLTVGFFKEAKQMRNLYREAVAMEIVDGEMEVLRAGYWKEFNQGTQPYPTTAQSMKNLPEGELQLTLDGKRLQLEWTPKEERYQSGRVVREVNLP